MLVEPPRGFVDLVAHVGQELALGAVGGLGRMGGLEQLFLCSLAVADVDQGPIRRRDRASGGPCTERKGRRSPHPHPSCAREARKRRRHRGKTGHVPFEQRPVFLQDEPSPTAERLALIGRIAEDELGGPGHPVDGMVSIRSAATRIGDGVWLNLRRSNLTTRGFCRMVSAEAELRGPGRWTGPKNESPSRRRALTRPVQEAPRIEGCSASSLRPEPPARCTLMR